MKNEMNVSKMSNEEIIDALRGALDGDIKIFEAIHDAIPEERLKEIQDIMSELLLSTCKDKGIKLTITEEDDNGNQISKESNF